VNQTPVPARLYYRFTRTIQTGKKLRETARCVVFNARFAQLASPLIQRAQHAVLLVNVDSYVVHENSSFRFCSSLRTGMLLSFYLTPSAIPSGFDP
jgi:hypothetical protein